jgi:DNA-binding NarL/FixJ family response regulator
VSPRKNRNVPHSSPKAISQNNARTDGASAELADRVRVFIVAENRLLREALSRVITKCHENCVAGLSGSTIEPGSLLAKRPSVLLIASRGNFEEDCAAITGARSQIPDLRILLIGMARDEEEFVRYVRAGIDGYLLRDASAQEVLEAVRSVHNQEAVCPRCFCAALFREVKARVTSEAARGNELRITRRQQQLIPLIAQGLTNKEIAQQLSLSEFTVKNHIYRMMRKSGARSRLAVAQLDEMRALLAPSVSLQPGKSTHAA